MSNVKFSAVHLPTVTDTKVLARNIVGDGKSPNLWFLTIGYGWYLQLNEVEEGEAWDERSMEVKCEHMLEPVTVVFEDLDAAKKVFNSIPIETHKEISRISITSVLIEDRRNGCVMEKRLVRTFKGNFTVDKF